MTFGELYVDEAFCEIRSVDADGLVTGGCSLSLRSPYIATVTNRGTGEIPHLGVVDVRSGVKMWESEGMRKGVIVTALERAPKPWGKEEDGGGGWVGR